MKTLSALAREIFEAGLEGAHAGRAVRASLAREGSRLRVFRAGGRLQASYDLRRFSRVFVIGAGKAAGPMALGLEQRLGPWARKIAAGLVLVPPGDRSPLRGIRKRTATHPIPSASGAKGASQILDVLRDAGRGDLVIALVSGGVSAMAALPVPGVSLRDFQKLTAELLRSGASIAEINAVRKHLSLSTGGRMAEAAFPAEVLVLVASDVEGNRLDVIGSGPFAPDPTTFRGALAVLRRYGLAARVPRAIRAHLEQRGAAAQPKRQLETPKPGARCFVRVRHVIVADPLSAVSAASRRAARAGFRVRVLDRHGSAGFGPIEDVARAHVKAVACTRGSACILSSGEASVRIPRGCRGLGGRNQELALRLGVELAFLEGRELAILCAGTDGIDGPTDAAGACVDASTLAAAKRRGRDPRHFIENHDSYRFFKEIGQGLIRTGRTGTNLLDLRILLIRPLRSRALR